MNCTKKVVNCAVLPNQSLPTSLKALEEDVTNDFIRFLTDAHASCNETIEHLEILIETESLSTEKGQHLLEQYDTLGR